MYKITFVAPAVNGIEGSLFHKKSFIISETTTENAISFYLTKFVMETGVNRDMVKITKEKVG